MGVVDYSGTIKITFDKAIATALGSTYNMLAQSLGTIIYTSQSRPAAQGFDGSLGTQWEPSTAYPQHLGKNFGSAKTIGKVAAYLGGSYKPNGYKVRASTDGTNWVDITAGNFPNVTGWQEVIFAPASYQYWCLQILSAYNTYTWVYELQFYEVIPSFPVAGWVITGYEPSMVPDGTLVPTTYTVKKVTKSEDNLSIIVWLKLSNRLLYPQGLITVQYIKSLGGLAGPFSALIEDFTITFTPTNITPIFKPNDVENVSLVVSGAAVIYNITYNFVQDPEENISLSVSGLGIRYNINGIPE